MLGVEALVADNHGAMNMFHKHVMHPLHICSGHTTAEASLSMSQQCAPSRCCIHRPVQPPQPKPIQHCLSCWQVLGFVDLGGHEKYLKTALYGMTCMLPDYVLLCHNASLPALSRVFREHLAAALALRIPVAIILTKVCCLCILPEAPPLPASLLLHAACMRVVADMASSACAAVVCSALLRRAPLQTCAPCSAAYSRSHGCRALNLQPPSVHEAEVASA